jgi:hypothetical protein
MSTIADLLQQFDLHPPSAAPGRYYTTCARCSATRSRAHQNTKVLGITIDDKGVQFGCNHCGWTGGAYYNGSGKPEFEAVYDYVDENGELLFQVCRKRKSDGGKDFPQRRPNGHGGWIWGTKGVRKVPFRLPELIEALASEHVILIVEGEKDVLNLAKIGIVATCNPGGASEPDKKSKWRQEYSETLRGADIVILPDHDAPGYAHADAVAYMSSGIAKRVRMLKLADHWPECPKGGDVSDWLAAGHSREELDALIEQTPDFVADAPKPNGHGEHIQFEPCTISETLNVFERWLILPSRTPLYAVLGTVAANLLPGDPVWLGIIGPGSSAKTELLNSTSMLAYVVQAGTLTPAGLLSGTPKKQYDKGAKGGLLRQIGEFGIISLKDFGSVLSMRPDAKAEVLAALREVYDGEWTRHLGTDGGKTLHWKGKVGLLFGATGVIDSHHSVIGAMGERFLLSRLAPDRGQFRRALEHVGDATQQMRKELAYAVACLFAGRRPEPRPISDAEIDRIDRIISLVVKLRGPVERDRNTREIEAVYGAEGTARIGLTLERLLAGLDTLGVDRATALDVVESVAFDSVPPIRRNAYGFLDAEDVEREEIEDEEGNRIASGTSTPTVAKALGLPTITVRRALEDLAAYGLLMRIKQESPKPDLWTVTAI